MSAQSRRARGVGLGASLRDGSRRAPANCEPLRSISGSFVIASSIAISLCTGACRQPLCFCAPLPVVAAALQNRSLSTIRSPDVATPQHCIAAVFTAAYGSYELNAHAQLARKASMRLGRKKYSLTSVLHAAR